ncbi:27060_t:CDS:2, partial [Racocetra persica]
MYSEYARFVRKFVFTPVGHQFQRILPQKKNFLNRDKTVKPFIQLNRGKFIVAATIGGSTLAVLIKLYINFSQYDVISPDKFIPLTINKITPVNHNTSIFRLKFPKPLKETLPITSCFHIKDDSIQIVREYTPISPTDERNYIEFLIKRYNEGYLSRYIHSLKEGNIVEVRGPILTFPYTPNMKTHIGMICGGTGITPMYQLIKHILSNPDDKTKLYMIYANVTKQDILLLQELDQLSQENPDQLKIFYTLDQPPDDELWTQGVGYVSQKAIKNHIPGPQEDVLVLVCGPDGMIRYVSGDKARDLSQGPVG